MRAWLTLLVAVAVIAGGCAGPAANPKLLGTWQTPTGGTIQFKPDGTAVMTGPNGSATLFYRQTSPTTVELRRGDGTGGPITWHIKSIDERELVLDESEGPQVLKRVP